MNYGIEDDVLLNLYTKMKRVRMFEDAIAEDYPKRNMHTPIHLYTGQEAVAAGICENLTKDDYVVSNHRSHGHYIAKGGDTQKLIAELYNKETGCTKGYGGSMHIMDQNVNVTLSSSIVAGGVPIGTGYGLASKLAGNDRVTVIFLGDAASEEGCVYESICFAKLKHLPVIYVCENNMYSISTGLDKREPVANIADKFSTIIPIQIVDGNDAITVYKAGHRAIEAARSGNGPTFIECKTYRLKDHHNVFTGVEQGYRTQEEWEIWNKKSPLTLLERQLKQAGLLDNEIINDIEENIQKEITKAFKFALESKLPNPNDLQLNIFAK